MTTPQNTCVSSYSLKRRLFIAIDCHLTTCNSQKGRKTCLKLENTLQRNERTKQLNYNT